MYKKIISYILSITLFLIIIIGCSNKLYKWVEIGKNTTLYNEYEKIINYRQLDSICDVDNLNKNYKAWYNMPYYDNETKKKIVEYSYFKQKDTIEQIMYILIPIDSINTHFKITKRITRKNNNK